MLSDVAERRARRAAVSRSSRSLTPAASRFGATGKSFPRKPRSRATSSASSRRQKPEGHRCRSEQEGHPRPAGPGMGRYQYSRPPQSWNRHRQQRALRGRSGLEQAPLRQGSQHRQAGIAPEPGSRMDQSAGPASADRGRCALERGARMPKADRGNLRLESGQHAWEGRARRLHLANRPVSLLSGLMTCGCCGGKVGIILSNRLGRLNHHRRGPCTNNRVPISFSRPRGDPDGLLGLRKPGGVSRMSCSAATSKGSSTWWLWSESRRWMSTLT